MSCPGGWSQCFPAEHPHTDESLHPLRQHRTDCEQELIPFAHCHICSSTQESLTTQLLRLFISGIKGVFKLLRRRSWPPSVPFKAKSLSRQKLGWQNGATGKGACHQSVNPSQSPITYMMKEKMAPHKLFAGFYTWVGAGMDGHVCACTHMRIHT